MLKFANAGSPEVQGAADTAIRQDRRAKACMAFAFAIGAASILLGLAVIAGWENAVRLAFPKRKAP